jgi:hypothetical protein
LGHDTGALMPIDDSVSQASQSSSQVALVKGKSNTVDYLKKGRQQKESVRDFILNAREILMAQISINDKTEETELLKEYIIMEKERLDANKKTFDEDKDKYEKYKMDLQARSAVTEEQVRDAHRKIDEL